MDSFAFILLGLIMVLCLILSLTFGAILLLRLPLRSYIMGLLSGLSMTPFQLVGMKLRRTPVHLIIVELIKAHKAGVKDVTAQKLEAHYLANGHIAKVVDALISSQAAGMPLTFEHAAQIDLAGRNVLLAVRGAIEPQVIEIAKIPAVTQGGVLLQITARVTVRPRIERLVGGAREATIIARVRESIIGAVGNCKNHKAVLAQPDLIAAQVINLGITAGTAFELLSFDIAKIDVIKNARAELELEEARANMIVARAHSEELHAWSVADERSQRARVQQMKALLLAAESVVPGAMAEAIREGNF